MKIIDFPMTEENINYLITCEKEIIETEHKDLKSNQGHKRNNFRLLSSDEKHQFSAFLRVNITFPENFSIGLVYQPVNDREIMLFRCNGPHHHKEKPNSEHHISYHYHIEKEENILEGINPMNHSVVVEEYSTYVEAFQFFISKCNIVNAEKFFPSLTDSVFSFMDE
jgi:hypothetical protein